MKKHFVIALLALTTTFTAFAKTEAKQTITCKNTEEKTSFVLVKNSQNQVVSLKVTLDGMQSDPQAAKDFTYTGKELAEEGSSYVFKKEDTSISEIKIQKASRTTVLASLKAEWTKVDDAQMEFLLVCTIK